MQRIAIVGTTGSGKSTLGEQLSGLLGFPFVDLDALGWGPNWTQTPAEELSERVAAALESECWITAGNYSRLRPMVWGQADTLIWLDYALRVIYARLIPRTVRRVRTREELWAGNHETFRGQFMSRDSLLYYAARTHNRRRREFAAALARPEYAHLNLLRFRAPADTEAWLARLARSG